MEKEQENPQQFSPEDVQAMQQLLLLAKAANTKRPNVQGKAGGQDSPGRKPIDYMDLFWYMLERLKYVIIVALIGALVGGIYGYRSFSPTYTATSKLYILGSNNSSALQAYTMTMGSADYLEVFKTWEVHETVRQALGLNYSYAQMQNMISVSVPNNSRVIYVTVRNSNPRLAADIANEYALAAKNFILKTMDAQEPNMFSLALVPSANATRSSSSFIMQGFLIGAAIPLALFGAIYYLDDSPSSAEDIEWVTGMDILTVIPQEYALEKEKEAARKNRKRGGQKK